MDYFESICKMLLEDDGFWVRQSYKVELTKEEKKLLGKPSLPRPEIDLLAFNHRENEVLIIEVKSYFDSKGVKLGDLEKTYDLPEGRYSLFTCEKYSQIVQEKVKDDLVREGLIPEEIKIKLGLIFGKVIASDAEKIKYFCQEKNWFYWSPEDIRKRVQSLASKGYENEPSIITAKILCR